MKGRFWDAIRPQKNPNTQKKSNGGTQYYQQDRVYMMADVAMCLPSQIPRGSYLYLVYEEDMGSGNER